MAKEAKYHHSCKSAYLWKARVGQSAAVGSDGGSTCHIPSEAIKNLQDYIDSSVIIGKRPELMTLVHV